MEGSGSCDLRGRAGPKADEETNSMVRGTNVRVKPVLTLQWTLEDQC